MKRLNIAMLSEQVASKSIETGDELVTDSRALQVEQAESQISQLDAVIDEAQDASQAVEDVANSLEKQEKVSEEVVQVAQEMLGYLTKRTGLKATSAIAAMESFKSGDVYKKERLIAELRIASENFKGQVTIAQEGVLDKITNKLSLIVTSNKSLSKELEKVSAAFDEGTPRQEDLDDPAFASVLNPENKESLSAQDIIKFAGEIEKRITDPKITEAISKVNNALEEAKKVKGGFFTIKDSDLNIINKQIASLTQIYDDLAGVESASRGKVKTTVSPLDKSSKETLVKSIENLMSVKEIEDSLKQVKKTISITSIKSGTGSNVSFMAKQTVVNSAYSIYRILGQLMKLRFEVAHACVKYIKASTNKGGAIQATPKEESNIE